MPTINLTDPVNDTANDATLIANNNAALETLLNGGLDDANIAADAAIAVSKLALTGIWQQIEAADLTGTSTTITVPQTYKDLRLTIKARTNFADYVEGAQMRFAGDTGANYDLAIILGNNNAVSHTTQDNQTLFAFAYYTGANALADVYAIAEVQVPFYRDADYRAFYATYSAVTGQSGADQKRIGQSSGVWQNATADALTSITLLGSGGGTFQSGSKYVLEGRV